MAREHEMVGTKRTIPKGMFTSNEVKVINGGTSHGIYAVPGVRHVQILNHSCHAKGQEVKECPIGVSCPELIIPLLHLIYKISLCAVYAFAWSIMEHRNLSFFVHIYLQPFLHF